MSYTTVMIIEGILLNEEEWKAYVKTLWDPQVYAECEKLFQESDDDGQTFYGVLKEKMETYVSGEYSCLETVERRLKKIGIPNSPNGLYYRKIRDQILELGVNMNGLSWFTWPCCSKLCGKLFILGRRIDSQGVEDGIDDIFNNVVEVATCLFTPDDLPEMFEEKPIRIIQMLDDCPYCS